MNKAQRELLNKELEDLNKEKKVSTIAQVVWGVVILLIFLVSWPNTLLILFTVLLFLGVGVYYIIKDNKRKERIKEIEFKLAGEDK